WCFYEIDETRKRNVLFPVLIDDIEPPGWLGRIYTTKLTGWSERSSSPLFQKLANDLAAVLGFPEKSAEKAQGFESPWDIKFKTTEAGTQKAEPEPPKSDAGDAFTDPTVEFSRTSASRPYRFPSNSLHEWTKRPQYDLLIGL